jgi:hypothetical protein
MSKAVDLILESEMETAKDLPRLVEKAVKDISLSRYQYLGILVEISAAISMLKEKSSDEVFKELAKAPRKELPHKVNDLMGPRSLKVVA